MGRLCIRDNKTNEILAEPDYKGFYLSQVERKDGKVTAYVNSEEDIDTVEYTEDTTLEEVKKRPKREWC